jgi:transcriptional regulator with XRE-family HTH domain
VESLDQWLSEQGLGTRLRGLRAQAGLSGKQLADAAGWAQSKVSRIESGKQQASAGDIETWARLTSASTETAGELLRLQQDAQVASTMFSDRMSHGQAAVQDTYYQLALKSSVIRYFQTVFVPGPLQIPEYTRRVFTEMITLHDLKVDDVEAAITSRQRRAQLLYEPGKRWEFLITEPVLRFLLPSPEVMRTQLDRLQSVIGLEHVRFGIVPLGTELAWSPQNMLEIYVGEQTVAVTETFADEHWYRGEKAELCQRAIDLVWEEAVEGEAARALITQAMRALPD